MVDPYRLWRAARSISASSAAGPAHPAWLVEASCLPVQAGTFHQRCLKGTGYRGAWARGAQGGREVSVFL